MVTANTRAGEREIYSRIPLRTWRWLGVNEARLPANINASVATEAIAVAAGEAKDALFVYRDNGQRELTIDVAEGAELKLACVQLATADAPCALRVTAKVGRGAKFAYTAIEAGAKETATELCVELAGDEASADVWAFYFAGGEEHVDLNYIIKQAGRRTDANMQVRGALLGHSEKIFRGTLDFLRGAKGSIGRENEEVMLLSPTVRNRSVPLMLSHEDDVDGHHAVSVGRMDEDKLFYLMSRGLDLAEAQRLVVEASFQPVLARVPDEALRAEISDFIKGRLEESA